MKNVVDIGVEKIFQPEGELTAELLEVVDKFRGKLSTVSALGAIELVKASLLEDILSDE